ncbi:MAG: response regulator transcription factor [Frankiales bacterium]|nr:MAG: response regulator transcription factor [Frankiales bacterium]
MPSGPRVLLVEDDTGIGAGLVRALESQGYRLTWCQTGAAALQHPLGTVDLVLLDLGLPDLNGLEVCRQLRRDAPSLPVLMITARGSETDVVVGLDAGADDYLVKPFRLSELLARLRAHTRRLDAPAHRADQLEVGDLRVDVDARQVLLAGRPVELRPKEFDLLVALMRAAGRVVTRQRLMEQVWDGQGFGSTKTVDVHVAALRQRLGEAGPDSSRITTLRGVGYRFELPSGPAPDDAR